MNNLYRELAPISDAAWADLEEEARRTFGTYVAGRRVVDVDGPSGPTLAAVNTGRLGDVAAPADGVIAHLRESQPLVRLRVPFTLSRYEIDSVERGAQDADGNERQILRANMPFGSPGSQEYGTYYIGYAASASVTEQMLENMFIGDPPGNTDRILDFSTAETGTLFFAPSADFLDDPPDAPGASVAAVASGAGGATGPGEAVTTSEASGSLGIGSLRRSTSP